MPSAFFAHVDTAVDALRGIPQQLAVYMSLPAFSEMSCASYTSSLDTTVMLPRPISQFRRCGLTQTCVGRCGTAISEFFKSYGEASTPLQPTSTESVHFEIAEWTSHEDENWQPIAVQTFTEVPFSGQICKLQRIVLEARTELQQGHHHVAWRVTFLCFRQGDSRATASMRFSESFAYITDDVVSHNLAYKTKPQADSDVLNCAWIVQPTRNSDVQARVLMFVTPSTGNNGVYELLVHRADSVTGRWLLKAEDARHPEICPHVYTSAKAWMYRNDEYAYLETGEQMHIKQVLLLPSSHGVDIVARLTGNINSNGRGVPFELALVVRDGPEQTCYGMPLKGSPAAHQLDFDVVFKQLILSNFFLFFHDNSLYAWDKAAKTFTEMSAHIPDNDLDVSNGYLNRTDSGTAVREQAGFHSMSNMLSNRWAAKQVTDTEFKSYAHSLVLWTATDRDGAEKLMIDVIHSVWYTRKVKWYTSLSFTHRQTHYDFQKTSYNLPVPIEVESTCTYLDCTGCSTSKLKNACFAAQRCVMARCIGVVVNTNNIFCAFGILLREVMVLQGSGDGSLYVLVVELLTSVVEQYFLNSRRPRLQDINLQSVSNLYLTVECDIKNVLGAIAALLPAYSATVFRIVKQHFYTKPVTLAGQHSQAREGILNSFSPQEVVDSTGITFAGTQLIYQMLLGVIHLSMRNIDIGLCLLNKFLSTTNQLHSRVLRLGAPNINIVLNSAQLNYDTHAAIDTCDVLMGVDTQDLESHSQKERRIFELIRDGGLVSSSRLRSPAFDLYELQSSVASLITAKTGLVRTWMKLTLSNLIKWVMGVVYGVAGLQIQMQQDECTNKVKWEVKILQCVESDASYYIPEDKDSTGWCTGYLRLAKFDGTAVVVLNELSYHQLRSALEPDLGTLIASTSAHGSDSSNVKNLNSEMLAKIGLQQVTDLPAASVLMRCRDNYMHRRWDSGAFEDAPYYDQYIETQVQVDASMKNLARKCLREGSSLNTIEACTLLVHPDIREFFTYTHVPGTNYLYPDACKFLSATGLGNELKKCGGVNIVSTPCSPMSECAVNLALQVYKGQVGIMPVDSYVVTSSMQAADRDREADKAYTELSQCILTTLDNILNVEFSSLVRDMDLILVSSEGDLLHQITDCVFLGNATHSDYLPNNPSIATIENMRYQPGQDTVCNGTDVINVSTGHVVYEHTCGSSARIGILSHLKHQFVHSSDKHIEHLIRELLQEIRHQVAQTSLYDCVGACCTHGALCADNASFAPNIEFEHTLAFQDIVHLDTIETDFFVHAMRQQTVRASPVSCRVEPGSPPHHACVQERV